MNKNLAALLTAAGVLFVIAGGLWLWQSTQQASDESAQSQSATEQSAAQNQSSVFDALPTGDTSFVATMSGQAEREFAAELRYDGKGNSAYTVDYGGGDGEMTMYRFGSEHISCYANGCFRLPDTDGDGNASEVKYDWNTDEVADFARSARYDGRADCGGDTCDKWNVSTDEFSGSFYLNDARQIKRVEGAQSGVSWRMDYRYEPVTIERPQNVIDSPLL